jgi:hypothetical protein
MIDNSGLIQQWRKRFYLKYFGANYARIEKRDEFKDLDLDQTENAFYIIIYGILAPILACLFEIFTRKII